MGLDATICSGSKFNDPGDATHHHNPHDQFRLLVDCKYTDTKSYSVSGKFMSQWTDRSTELGKRFIVALRLQDEDYVVMSMNDFEEMWNAVRAHDPE